MSMHIKLVIAGLFSMIVSCKKENDKIAGQKSVTELLTQKEWILTAAGFDDNKNGVLDDMENSIQDCQEDNSYTFNIGGTGAALDNAVSCGTPVNNNFDWKLLHNDTKLEIESEPMFILRLNENELILSPDTPWLTVNFVMVYRH